MDDSTGDKLHPKKLKWQVANPYKGLEKSMNNMMSSFAILVGRQVKEMEKDLIKAKKLYES